MMTERAKECVSIIEQGVKLVNGALIEGEKMDSHIQVFSHKGSEVVNVVLSDKKGNIPPVVFSGSPARVGVECGLFLVMVLKGK